MTAPCGESYQHRRLNIMKGLCAMSAISLSVTGIIGCADREDLKHYFSFGGFGV